MQISAGANLRDGHKGDSGERTYKAGTEIAAKTGHKDYEWDGAGNSHEVHGELLKVVINQVQ